jgi:hypothetical protein
MAVRSAPTKLPNMETRMVLTTMLDTRIGSIELDKGLPATDDDVRNLFDASDSQRACQAYLPIVSLAQWQHSARYEPLEVFFAHRFAPDFELMNGNHH